MRTTGGVAFATVIIAVLAAAAFAQGRRPLSRADENQFLVSAKAGAVNIVEGDVSYKRGKADWDMLIAGDDLQTGDVVRTGADGRAEILLNPGSYLRLSESTQAVLSDTSLDNLRVQLASGSAIIEASAVDGWTGTVVTLTTPKATFSIARGGLYRFNVDQSGRSEVIVHKGRILIDDTSVREGSKAVVDGGGPVLSAFDKKSQDSFDLWSKDRAKILVAANKSLSQRALRSSLLGFRSFSTWFFDPFLGCYTFLPGFYGYRSPYGWGYRACNPYYYPWGGRSYGNSGSTRPTVNGAAPRSGWSATGGGETIHRPAPSSSSSGGTTARPGTGSWGGGGVRDSISRPAPSHPRGRP